VSPFFPVCALPLYPYICMVLAVIGHGKKNPITATEGNTSPRRYPRLAAIQHAGIPSSMTRAHRTTPPNRSSHAPRAPPISSAPQTQSTPHHNPISCRHPVHRSTIGPHPIASAGPPHHLILPILRASPAQILRCSSISNSTRQPRPDLAMLEYKMEDTSLSTQI
jgi:hypothetical protein